MSKLKICTSILTALLCLTTAVVAQSSRSKLQLKQRIKHIIDSTGGKVGVGVQGLDFGDELIINGNHEYPMMSVFKFPLAIAILHKVDQGELKLDQKFHLAKANLDTSTWSPMLKDFPDQDLDISLADLLTYAVSKSDNNACDFLYDHVAGGTTAVNKYLHSKGINDINIVYTEGEMDKQWEFQYKNWCKPAAALQMLRFLYSGQLLAKPSNDFLISIMRELPDWGKRITFRLPDETNLIHKTGSSGVNNLGVMAALNDIGILTLPNGKHIAIAVFVSDFKAPQQRGVNTIAAIAKVIWDHYSKTCKK